MGMDWAGCWGVPWSGWGWVFPLIGLLCMVVMVFVCIRSMGGRWRVPMNHGRPSADDREALRREVRELKDEIQNLRATR